MHALSANHFKPRGLSSAYALRPPIEDASEAPSVFKTDQSGLSQSGEQRANPKRMYDWKRNGTVGTRRVGAAPPESSTFDLRV